MSSKCLSCTYYQPTVPVDFQQALCIYPGNLLGTKCNSERDDIAKCGPDAVHYIVK